MAFKFKKTQSLKENVRRLYKKGAKRVVRALDKSDELQGIHEARKEIKRLRAVLRLLRAEMSDRDCRGVMRPLRKAAKLLGPPRDARVLLETLNELNSRFEGALPRKSVAHLKSVLERNSETARVQFAESEGACRVCRLIRKSRKRVREITLKSRSWRQLEQNLGGSFIGSRTAFETARTEQSAENFHEWRKRVQDVRNQIDLLDSRKGAALSPVLKDLSQILGLDHDMVMLRKFAESHFASKLQRLRIRPLNESLKPFEEKLQVTILSRGAALYAGLPLGLRPASFPAKLPA